MLQLTLKNGFIWGIILWLIGYILGMILFFIVPQNILGWIITPIGIAITIWVIAKKVPILTIGCYSVLGLLWSVLAILLDYIFIFILLHPSDGYYKLDVYLYYITTFLLPIVVGIFIIKKKQAHI